ncbi:hypothetical protein RKD52_001565 [Metabacillus sp. SLBN-84]
MQLKNTQRERVRDMSALLTLLGDIFSAIAASFLNKENKHNKNNK